MTDAEQAAQDASRAVAAADQAESDFNAGLISEEDLHNARNAATDAQNAATDAHDAEFLASQSQNRPAPMPQPAPSFDASSDSSPFNPFADAVVPPSPLAQQASTTSNQPTFRSPAFDINGNLVTIDLLGGDYANLPAGYYETPGQAIIARHDQNNTGSNVPISAQQVGQLYSDPNAQTALQTIFSAPPPPPSTYIAPTAPVAVGWNPPPAAPLITSADIIAQSYRDNGMTLPSDAVIQQIISGEITAPLTAPLPVAAPVPVDNLNAPSQTPQNPAAVMTAAQYAAQRSDLLINWVRAQNPAWVISHPDALSVVQFVNQFPTLTAFLANDYGQAFAPGPDPTIDPAIGQYVAGEIPADVEPPGRPPVKNPGPTAIQYAAERSDLVINWARAHSPAWVASHPAAAANITFITNFPTLSAYLSNDFGSPLSGPEPTVSADVMAYVENEIPAGFTYLSGGGKPQTGIPVQGKPTDGGMLARPQIQVGTTSAGWPVLQVGDNDGVTKQWIVSPNGTLDLVNAPVYGTMFHDSQTDKTVVNSGGGVVTTNGLAKPQIQVGTTSAGWPINQVGDDMGVTKQWIVDPGPPSKIVDLLNAPTYGELFHDAVTDAAVKTNGGGIVTAAGGTTAGKSNLLLLAAAAALAYFAFAR